MKKAISLLLVLGICLSLWGCGMKQEAQAPAAVNPIVGTWEAKSAGEERVFTFTETDGALSGSYKFYNYSADKWGEFTFTVKEQTENSVTLLIDDGTMDQIPYFVLGDRLYMDGIVYTNNTVEVPVVADITVFPMVDPAQPSIYEALFDFDGLFLGMHMKDLEAAIDRQLEWKGSGKTTGYDWYSSCGYYADMNDMHSHYYCLRFGLDAGQRLVHMEGQGHYEESQFNRWQSDFSAAYGEPKYSQWVYSPDNANLSDSLVETWIWTTKQFVIELKTSTNVDESTPSYFTLCCYYEPEK